MIKFIKYCFIFYLIILIFIGCKQKFLSRPLEELDNQIKLQPHNTINLQFDQIILSVQSTGEIDGISHEVRDSTSNNSTEFAIYQTGLWVGSETDTNHFANIAWVGSSPRSNYTTISKNDSLGVFLLEQNMIDNEFINWPTEKGFPMDINGMPKIKGDIMTWSALQSDSIPISPLSQPHINLEFTHSVWGYLDSDYSKTIFQEYSITNISHKIVDNIFIGFHTDIDINGNNNSTGYDSTRALVYTYSTNEENETFVAGYTFLKFNNETIPTEIVNNHRLLRKNTPNDEWNEYGIIGPEQIIFALKGLSNSGQPMINPISGNKTKFAFTGNPITQTGWIDESLDVRSLLNINEFSLYPNSTVHITIVITIAGGNNLENAIINLKNKIDNIRLTTELWE